MNSGQSSTAVRLAEVAHSGRLAIYAGAGLSRGSPTNLPNGPEVARRCHERLVGLLGADALDRADALNLTSVADVVAGLDQGADLVRHTAVDVAEFTSARPNFSHEILALLLLEGIVVVITTNWDDCIERSGGDERVLAVISGQERQQTSAPALLKVHGCATRPPTLLITTEDLTDPPSWARDAVNAHLSGSCTVFVGTGDIAGYVENRIREVVDTVGSAGQVIVVSPDIKGKWNGTQWAEILPKLPEEYKVAASANTFLDHLASACLRRVVQKITEELSGETAAVAFARARSGFEGQTSIDMLRWLRGCAFPRSPGTSATQHPAFAVAMIALGRLGDRTGVAFHPPARAVAGETEYELLVAVGTVTSSKMRREAETRFTVLRARGERTEDMPVFLVSGGVGKAATPAGSPGDIYDDSDTSDILSGPLAVAPVLVRAEDYAA